ncbi:MAG: hypothetical protein CL489_08700 [Acidobacteria bacterium]|nr:hypothetical protein [Acidobacteriota bacterium]|tara:strand:- start:29755 stop:30000 length:246 start_codon:yes stop_codon:yes gene_type:complete
MIENIIVDNGNVLDSDKELIFGDEEVITTEVMPLPNLLHTLGVYKSTSQARKAGRVGDIPTGYTEYKASKKVRLFIWNPTE